MVSDQEIASCVESLLRQQSAADPASGAGGITFAGVVQQLEAKLGIDLSHKAGFIRERLAILLHQAPPNPSPKDHFALQHHPALHPFQQHQQFLFQQQQQQHHHQQQQQQQQQHAQQHHAQQHQQGFALHPHLMSRHQIPSQSSPFTNLPHQHELVFQCNPPPVQTQQLRQQQQAAAAAAALQSQNGQFVPGAAPAPPPAKPSAQTGVKRKGGTGGLSKVCGVSPELEAIVGEPAMPRTQIVKQLWAYIRKNNLQDPNNKRKIICNDELRLVFETDSTDMFQMNKLLAKHIRPLETTNEAASDKRSKATEEAPAAATESEPDNHDYTVVISDALSEFFGTGEREMLHSEVTKQVSDYIKVNNLEDPSNAMVVLFDEKLKKLFGCDSLSAIGVREMLAHHLTKKS